MPFDEETGDPVYADRHAPTVVDPTRMTGRAKFHLNLLFVFAIARAAHRPI